MNKYYFSLFNDYYFALSNNLKRRMFLKSSKKIRFLMIQNIFKYCIVMGKIK